MITPKHNLAPEGSMWDTSTPNRKEKKMSLSRANILSTKKSERLYTASTIPG